MWVLGVDSMRSEYSAHSFRRTKPSIIYKTTGNLPAVQSLLGHSKTENTARYLGMDVEHPLALAENTSLGAPGTARTEINVSPSDSEAATADARAPTEFGQ